MTSRRVEGPEDGVVIFRFGRVGEPLAGGNCRLAIPQAPATRQCPAPGAGQWLNRAATATGRAAEPRQRRLSGRGGTTWPPRENGRTDRLRSPSPLVQPAESSRLSQPGFFRWRLCRVKTRGAPGPQRPAGFKPGTRRRNGLHRRPRLSASAKQKGPSPFRDRRRQLRKRVPGLVRMAHSHSPGPVWAIPSPCQPEAISPGLRVARPIGQIQ